jgi:hypothetical protein
MGRLVAKAGTIPWEELSATYGALYMEGLALLGTRRKQELATATNLFKEKQCKSANLERVTWKFRLSGSVA